MRRHATAKQRAREGVIFMSAEPHLNEIAVLLSNLFGNALLRRKAALGLDIAAVTYFLLIKDGYSNLLLFS